MESCVDHGRQGNKDGYCSVRYDGKTIYMHRLVFFQTNGYWPKVVRHSCDNPRCVNPTHLLGGDHVENMRDKVARNRQSKGTKHGMAKLTDEQVMAIRADYVPRSKEANLYTLVRKYSVDPKLVWFVVHRKIWTHI